MNKTRLEKPLGFEAKQTISDAVYQVSNDPDFRLELRPEVVKELEKRSRVKGRTVSLVTIKRGNY